MLNTVGISGGPLYNRVGDLQASSNIDGVGVDTFSVIEAWYEHSFQEGRYSILGGLHDYNSEFYALDYAGALLNSSFGVGPDVSQRGISIYPVTALGLRFRFQPCDNSYVLLGMYDGIPGSESNLQGTHVKLNKDDGLFYAAEVGITSTEEESETAYYKVAIGGWYHTTDFSDYAERDRSSASGGYIVGERKIFSESDLTQGLGIFGQVGLAQGDRNEIAQYLGAGLHYTGLFGGRDEDITTFGVAHARHGSQYLDMATGSDRAETAIELSYRAKIGYGFTIQPDVQYIVNPGTDSSIDNAVVVGSRVEVVF